MTAQVDAKYTSAIENFNLNRKPLSNLENGIAKLMPATIFKGFENREEGTRISMLARHVGDKVKDLPKVALDQLITVSRDVLNLLKAFAEKRESLDSVIEREERNKAYQTQKAIYDHALNQAIADKNLELVKVLQEAPTLEAPYAKELVFSIPKPNADGEKLFIRFSLRMETHGKDAGNYNLAAVSTTDPSKAPDEDHIRLHFDIGNEAENAIPLKDLRAVLQELKPDIFEIPATDDAQAQKILEAQKLIAISNQILEIIKPLNEAETKLTLPQQLLSMLHNNLYRATGGFAHSDHERTYHLDHFKANSAEGKFFRDTSSQYHGESGLEYTHTLNELLEKNPEVVFKPKRLTLKEAYGTGLRDMAGNFDEFIKLLEGLPMSDNFKPYRDELVAQIKSKHEGLAENASIDSASL